MNSKRIAGRILAGEKPVHWVTAAARRVLSGEDFDLVMQDLAKDMGLYDTSRFNAVKRELEARVEQERTAKKSAKFLTPMEAAEDLAAKLKAEYGVDAKAWDSQKLIETGWTAADAAVACEGMDISEEQLYERGPFKNSNMQPYEGLFLEPYSSWLMCIYRENTKHIAERIIGAEREGPAANDRDFFKSPAPRVVSDMTLERFRSIALEVLKDKQTPFPAAARLEYIKAKGAEFDLNVDDNWLTGLLNEASNGEFERLSRPEPTNNPTAPWG